MTTNPPDSVARVIQLPARRVHPGSVGALKQLAQRMGAWRRAHPDANFEEDMAEGARLAKELGL